MKASEIVRKNIFQSKIEIQKSLLKDNLIIFFTRIVEDLKKYTSPNFYGRISEIYQLLYPYTKNESAKSIFEKIKISNLVSEEGLILDAQERSFVFDFIKSLDNQCKLKDRKKINDFEKSLEKLVRKYFKFSSKLLEFYLVGKLISSVGGISNLYKMPSSTIQLIGAEKALFRHNAKGSDCPKYGLIYYSEKLKQSKNKGKTARQLANKLAISFRQDYFQIRPMMRNLTTAAEGEL